MNRRPRQVTPEELALWHHVVRDSQPLRGHAPPPAAPPMTAAPEERSSSDAKTARRAPPAPLASPPPAARPSRRLDPKGPVDLDRRSWLKLRRGLYPLDARLDLHGLTQAEAYDRLGTFLAAARARGNRCVLVITGRGLRQGGALRAMTPRWLEEGPIRPLVLAYAPAQLHHGGEGALYVLLRRRSG